MRSLFNRQKKAASASSQQTLQWRIEGMHCTSCSLNIDGELEDTDGVVSASTSYAKAKTTVVFDPEKVSEKTLQSTIESLGYTIHKE